ncbi:MAG: 5-methylcytosine-specific restriction endonuclease system specificity protein McrC [Candidatus Saccharibacteria bacterium]|nr:5-methylcytosine-specific restriction endonuclease system specificity protein McrC [Candidatus Saccharibacteria bacterium]
MIPIRNIYYMLSYAFKVLNEKGYQNLASENFQDADELYATILIQGIKYQLKRGFDHTYVEKSEISSVVRGKINLSDTLKTQTILRRRLVASYDEFSINSNLNQIIKATLKTLKRRISAKSPYQRELNTILYLLADVHDINIHQINWKIQYHRNNELYKLLVGICNLVISRQLQSEKSGEKSLREFFDDQRMCNLYEHFILNFYRRHFPYLSPMPAHINWNSDDGTTIFLPTMRTDITLTSGEKTLIIDAKYYESGILKSNTLFGDSSEKINSGNIYQIYSYVKNKDTFHSGNVSGMLLYAKTDDSEDLDLKYSLDGNTFYVKTLDLNQPFELIRARLIQIKNLIDNP